jgi:hypothetical protein
MEAPHRFTHTSHSWSVRDGERNRSKIQEAPLSTGCIAGRWRHRISPLKPMSNVSRSRQLCPQQSSIRHLHVARQQGGRPTTGGWRLAGEQRA